jgi:Arc/MetJ-type ribon-helix-helix transcriptional regulator
MMIYVLLKLIGGLPLPRNNETSVKYVTVSIPQAIADEMDALIKSLGYWPSRGAFVREACLTKIRDEKRRLRELREAENPHLARNRGKPKGENGPK